MAERPILFSAPMVRAILDGRKTQTRRVCKPADFSKGMRPGGLWADSVHPAAERGWIAWQGLHAARPAMAEHTKQLYREGFPCPYGAPGDRLWVRETWARTDYEDDGPFPNVTIYRADGEDGVYDAPGFRWHPSIHMPRWASRITLEVTGVRVERVQDISEADTLAEGFELGSEYWYDHFKRAWSELNGPRGYGWGVNPWVWVVEFRRA